MTSVKPQPLISRRDFLAGTVATIGLGTQIRVDAQALSAQLLEPIKTISHLPHRYHGWSTIAQGKSGRLFLSYSGGRESHVCPFGRVEFMQSDDDGRTWTWPQVIHDGPIDDRDSGILETHQGTLLATSFSSLAYQPILAAQQQTPTWSLARRQQWESVHNRLKSSEREAQLGQWMIRSTDGGKSWSPPYSSIVNSPHGPIQLADGRLFYAGKELWTGQKRVGACISEDDGISWQWLSEIPTRPGDQAANYHELHGVECQNGQIIVHIRNHNSTHNRETLQTESLDGGLTWTQPHSIGVWGLPSHLLKLRDHRLMMSYGFRRQPYGNQVRVSADHGATWSSPLTLSNDGASGDLGYPSTVELADQSFLTIWYEKSKGNANAVLRQAHWRLAS